MSYEYPKDSISLDVKGRECPQVTVLQEDQELLPYCKSTAIVSNLADSAKSNKTSVRHSSKVAMDISDLLCCGLNVANSGSRFILHKTENNQRTQHAFPHSPPPTHTKSGSVPIFRP